MLKKLLNRKENLLDYTNNFILTYFLNFCIGLSDFKLIVFKLNVTV